MDWNSRDYGGFNYGNGWLNSNTSNDSLSAGIGQIMNNLKGATASNQFSAQQARENREWEEYMSNTSYQRAMADMQAAGLNPASLTSSGIQGASTPSGSAASATNYPGSSPLGLIARAALAAITKGLTAKMSASAMKAAKAGSSKKVVDAVAKDAKTESLSAKYAAARDAEFQRVLNRNKEIEKELLARSPLR